ncbi:hypothetical protein [Methylocystis iwaonis]|uniref:hypothetical protein n=1 Tax=Methylocystis iwaonis TaxID=2885079 RepID=UPI002E7ACB53|nr:hypothetical protein [Methylocystis iwaonis]
MTDDCDAPPAANAPVSTGYLRLIKDAGRYADGAVIPDTPETRKALGDAARPATAFEIGVAGYMKREA